MTRVICNAAQSADLFPGASGPVAGGALILLLASAMAAPALSADELWASWQKLYSSNGYALSTEGVTRSGNTLKIAGFDLTGKGSSTSKNGTTTDSETEIRIPEVALAEQADGSVRVTLSPVFTLDTRNLSENGKTVSVGFSVTQKNLVTVASGTPDALSYRVTGPDIRLALIPPAPAKGTATEDSPQQTQFDLALEDFAATYGITHDAAGTGQSSDVTIGQVSLVAGGKGIAKEKDGTTQSEQLDMSGTLSDLSGSGRTFLPLGAAKDDFATALDKGASLSFKGSAGAGQLDLKAKIGKKTTESTLSLQSASLDTGLSPEGVRYALTLSQPRVALLHSPDPAVPVPLETTLDRAVVSFSFPLSQSAEEQPFDGTLALSGLAVSDKIWVMIDPTGLLPHDPASLTLDFGGRVKILQNLFTPDTLQPSMPPVEFERLDVKTLDLSVAGLHLSGQGGVGIDNSGTAPVPSGAVDLSLTGANKLMDGLIAMGVATKQQVMTLRMILGLYAVPAGDDAYNSKIELKPSGEILANGQRIR